MTTEATTLDGANANSDACVISHLDEDGRVILTREGFRRTLVAMIDQHARLPSGAHSRGAYAHL
jgi:hypothetical protein